MLPEGPLRDAVIEIAGGSFFLGIFCERNAVWTNVTLKISGVLLASSSTVSSSSSSLSPSPPSSGGTGTTASVMSPLAQLELAPTARNCTIVVEDVTFFKLQRTMVGSYPSDNLAAFAIGGRLVECLIVIRRCVLRTTSCTVLWCRLMYLWTALERSTLWVTDVTFASSADSRVVMLSSDLLSNVEAPSYIFLVGCTFTAQRSSNSVGVYNGNYQNPTGATSAVLVVQNCTFDNLIAFGALASRLPVLLDRVGLIGAMALTSVRPTQDLFYSRPGPVFIRCAPAFETTVRTQPATQHVLGPNWKILPPPLLASNGFSAADESVWCNVTVPSRSCHSMGSTPPWVAPFRLNSH